MRKAHFAETEPRPDEHNHEGYGDGYGSAEQPVLVFDLHETLTPDSGFPLTAPPFDGVREFMDRMVGRGCCLHITTASLRARGDQQVYEARVGMIEEFCRQHGLPISFIGPNIEADARLDDRMVEIPRVPDWYKIAEEAENRLLQSFALVKGTYQRRVLEPVGEDIEFPDPETVEGDHPRGYTTPCIDIDIHRTLNPAWGSSREAPPDPEAVEVVNRLYDEGFGIQFSCPGWNPATRSGKQSAQRLAGMQRYVHEHGIRYDRFVAKDDSDLHFDNKGVRFIGWQTAEAKIRAMLVRELGNSQPIPKRYGVLTVDERAVKVISSTPRVVVKEAPIHSQAFLQPAATHSIQIEYGPNGKPTAIRRA